MTKIHFVAEKVTADYGPALSYTESRARRTKVETALSVNCSLWLSARQNFVTRDCSVYHSRWSTASNAGLHAYSVPVPATQRHSAQL